MDNCCVPLLDTFFFLKVSVCHLRLGSFLMEGGRGEKSLGEGLMVEHACMQDFDSGFRAGKRLFLESNKKNCVEHESLTAT